MFLRRFLFGYDGTYPDGAHCIVGIWDVVPAPVIQLTEAKYNHGKRITDAVEEIATSLVNAYGLEGNRCVWVEH